MKKTYLLTFLLLCFYIGTTQTFSKKWSVAAFAQISDARYDKVARQNAVGIGAGIKINYRLNQQIGLLFEANSSYFGGTRELIIINGEHYRPKDGLSSIHAGLQYRLFFPLQMASSFGPSFSLGNTDWGFRQSLLLSFTKKEHLWLRFSFDHVFQDKKLINSDFGYLGYALVVRLF
ncbi:MAG: hypothetical protein ACOYVG_07770 [Bacteroidota bacterium]